MIEETQGAFKWNGNIYPYFHGGYNNTRISERAVEVSIAMDKLNQSMIALEVGAVLPHYIPDWPDLAHTVIDLHEDYPGVTRADVLTYEPESKLDFILCISTLDHLLSAEDVKTAVKRMKSWLTRGGEMLITLPAMQPPEIGGGAWLDELVLSGDLDMKLTRMDKMHPRYHGWQQVDTGKPPLPYNSQTDFANTLYLLEWWH